MSQIATKFLKNNAVTNTKLAQMNTLTIKGNNTGGSSNPLDLTVSQVNAILGDILADGSVAFAADQSMGSHKLTSVTDPTSAQDAATKNYVDSVASGLQPKQAVYAASTTNIVGTYNNGASGVGATFTVTATGAFSLDGTTPPANSRILLKDQSTGFQNGVYDLTVAGSLGVSPVLTRSSDYNTAADMDAGNLIPVINGTANNTTSWLQTATITTVGTDALTFVEWSYNPANFLLKANNLSDVASTSTAFANLSPLTTKGDLLTYSTVNARLGVGTDGQVLTADSAQTLGVKWATPSGTVSSVALSMPAQFSVSGSPITSSGTFTVSWTNESANTVFAGPSSGGSATPAFRSLVGADLPNPSSSTLGGIQSAAAVTHQWIDSISTSGVPHLSQPAFSDVSGTAAINQGGTGQTTASAAFAALSPMTTLGDITFEDATPIPVRLAGNTTTTKKFLTQTGNGTISAAPGWNTVALTDLPSQANSTLLGNTSGSSATPTAQDAAHVTAMLNQFTTSLQGVVSASGGGTTNFLRADNTWAAPPSPTALTYTVTAGEALSANDAVYICNSSDAARTAGQAYKLDPSNSVRWIWAGFCTGSVAASGTATIQVSGSMSGFSSLLTGQQAWGSITTPGGVQTSSPSSPNYIIPVGVAVSSTVLAINGALASAVVGLLGKSLGFMPGGTTAGNSAPSGGTTSITQLTFSNESTSVLSGTLGTALCDASGVSSNLKGYIIGGNNTSGSTVNLVQSLNFSTLATASLGAILSGAISAKGGGLASSSNGYVMGAGNGTSSSAIAKLVFVNETSSTLAATLGSGLWGISGTSSSSAGYALAGGTGSNGGHAVNKLLFSNDTNSLLGTGLTNNFFTAAGLYSSSGPGFGYAAGGNNSGGSVQNLIEGFNFSNDTDHTVSATLSAAKQSPCGVNSVLKGYTLGGADGGGVPTNVINGFTFSNETNATVTATLGTATTRNEQGLWN